MNDRFRIIIEVEGEAAKAELRKLNADLGNNAQAVDRSRSSLGGLKQTLGAVGLAWGALELKNLAFDSINLANAAAEVDSKWQAVFGTAEELNDALVTWSELAGVTEARARDQAATFGNLAQSAGLSLDATKDLTLATAELAGDLASFNNADPAAVFESLTKGILTTERESLKPLGIAISEAEVKQRALNIALEDGRDEVTAADRATASYEIAVRQAGKAIGDLERTQDSNANRTRRATRSVQELQTALGEALVPVYEDLLAVTERLIPLLEKSVDIISAGTSETRENAKATVEAGRAGDAWGVTVGYLKQGFESFLNPVTAGIDATLGVADAMDTADDAAAGFDFTMDHTEQSFIDSVLGMHVAAEEHLGATAEEMEVAEERIKASVSRLRGALRGDLFRDFREQQRIDRLLAPGFDERVGSVPEYAAGGVHVRPHLAVVGDVPEVTIPLDEFPAIMASVMGGQAGGGSSLTVNVYAGVGDRAAIGAEVVDAIAAYEASAGTGWRMAATG